MLAVFHIAGTSPVVYDTFKMETRIGAMVVASSFRTLDVMLSDPAVLCGFRFWAAFPPQVS